MPAVQARIVNVQHDGETESVIEDLTLSWTFKRSDVSTASWSIPLSHPNLERSGVFDGYYTTTGFAPKRTDWRIGVSGDNGVTWNTVHAGICGPVGVDTEKDAVDVVGVDWSAWLDQPYRFPAYTMDFETEKIRATDVTRIWAVPDNDAEQIITDLIDNLCSGTVWECVQITPSFIGTNWTTDPITDVKLGATETVLSKIKSLGELSEPEGYEFVMDWDKTFYVFHGRQFTVNNLSAAEVACAAYFAPSLDNIHSVKWLNNGPKATTTVGVPIGFPARKGFSTYAPSAVTYRDWWQMIRVGTTKDIIQNPTGSYIQVYTDTYGTRDRYPQKDLSISFDPTLVENLADPYWFFKDKTGYVIHVDSEDWFIDYWRIDAFFWIVEQTLSHDDAGNWKCTCVLEQINF